MTKNLSQIHLTLVLAKLTARRLLARRSTLVLLLIGLLPTLQAFWWILSTFGGLHSGIRPYGMFLHLQSIYFLTFYIPILSIFMGLGVLSDEFETKSFTFTSTRPLSASAIVLGRFFGHLIVSWVVLAVSLGCTYGSGMVFQFADLFAELPDLFNAIFIQAMGITAYLGIVAALGTFWRKFAILASCIWIFLFDQILLNVFPKESLQAMSVRYHVLAGSWENLPQTFFTLAAIESGSAFAHGMVCLFFATASVGLMIWWLRHFEIAMTNGSQ